LNSAQEGEIKVTDELLAEIEKTEIGAKWRDRWQAVGEAKGIAKGIAKGKAKSIIKCLTVRFEMPSAKLQKQIMKVNDIDKLDELVDFALTCVSLGEFATAFN
jgi:hypothetical protein